MNVEKRLVVAMGGGVDEIGGGDKEAQTSNYKRIIGMKVQHKEYSQ